MRRIVVVSLALLLLAVSSTLAVECELDQHGRVLLRAGGFWPLSSDTRDTFGTTWLDVGLEIMVTRSEKMEHFASFGWLSSDNDSAEAEFEDGFTITGDADINVFSVNYTQRTVPRNGFYAGGSVGAYFVDADFSSTTVEGTENFDGSDVVFGFKVMGGYEFSKNFGAEIAFQWTDNADVIDFGDSEVEEDFIGLSANLVARF